MLPPVLYYQRNKVGETHPVRAEEINRQEESNYVQKTERKRARKEIEDKRSVKEALRKEKESWNSTDMLYEDSLHGTDDEDVEYEPSSDGQEWGKYDVVEFLQLKLGNLSKYVLQYVPELQKKLKRNYMPIPNTAKASLRMSISPKATAIICSEFLKDLIAAGYLAKDMSYLACDRMKVERARKVVMEENKGEKHKIVGLGYDGRKDKNTRAIITDLNGNTKLVKVTEEHVSLSVEPEGEYLSHFVPAEPMPGEKPALKQAQQIVNILAENDSLDSVKVLLGDSTAMNTGKKGGVHTLIERLLDRKLLWGICQIHTNELPPRHLIRYNFLSNDTYVFS